MHFNYERISPYTFSLKISKNVQKKTKVFRKIMNRACFDEYFYRYILKVDKTYLEISFETFFKKNALNNVESFGRYFSFCPCLIWWSHSCLISFRWYDGIQWKLKDGFFPGWLKKPIIAQLGIMQITMNKVTE